MNEQMTREEMQQTIDQLREQVAELESLVSQIMVPIIPSILPDTILIPFAGELTPEFSRNVVSKVLNHVAATNTQTAILDFTALSIENPDSLSVFGKAIEELSASLSLMGIEVITVGFTPHFAREVTMSGLPLVNKLKSFSTFRSALQHLMKQRGLEMTGAN
ncbi:Anti-anti-sigma regulatory factor (antagonist of anti-sigma factor) [Bhargavaea cecembensis DSE10]|uniref:Anti-anti-sigma regulatory factor (Antagonist of anti-sigma factor) n=1 Tax=Bhargavaea cecembensis DSE10 TaxID=1235279 RepID=M7NDI5_9BACL|nr:Anti-anti-sigma regulatory factor (antagonist of anti-sigma factor) [Bhargavaea cecembensis]EMR05231.1 Anti-anti-sigma regulatory factor (antagonist of anti-sigma factor) [Bhargavaea cecembensis DSE10]